MHRPAASTSEAASDQAAGRTGTLTAVGSQSLGGPAAREALNRARDHLLGLQHEDGWWKAELQTNVTMGAEDLLLREFLGIREPGATARTARWIRSQQRPDGSWSNFHGGPGELSTTIEAYVALRLAGDSPQDEHMRAASEFARLHGGLERARVFTHIWLALFGAWPWAQVPVLPPELMLLPSWVPLNPYDFACWARQTVVALTIVLTYRPVRPLPFTLEELRGPEPWSPPAARSLTDRLLLAVDRGLHAYHHRPIGFLRRLSLARAERWIVDRQEADGSWGGIQPPWVYSIMALHLRGYGLDHPVIRRGLDGLEGFTIEEAAGGPLGLAEPSRRLEACQSPVWDTALALVALADAGLPGDDAVVVKAADWLLGEEIVGRGDWAVRRPHLPASGWAFEFANVNYPDVDDTAEVVLALLTVDHPQPERLQAAVHRATVWLEGMQCSDGGWAAFDADNCRELIRNAGGSELASARPGKRWVVVWTLGGQPRLRNGRGGSGTGGCGGRSRLGADPAGRALAPGPSERGRRLGRGLPILRRSGLDRPRGEHSLSDGLGAPCPARCRRTFRGGGAGCALAGRASAIGRNLGRAAVHRHRLSVRLLHQLPPVPACVPDHGSGTLAPMSATTTAPSYGTVMAQAEDENFPVASRFLPRAQRVQLLAIYGVARLIDDVGDEAPGDRGQLLDWLDREIDRALTGQEPEHPAMRALARAAREASLPAAPFHALVQANRQDQVLSRYGTFDDLLGYCRLSAAPVGELVLHVFGAATPERLGLSGRICAGLQVIEHIQDVAEDYSRGRIYMPVQDMERFGCRESDLAAPQTRPALRALLAFEAQRAAGLLSQGAPLARTLPPRPRLAVAGFVAGGRAALHGLALASYDVCPDPSRSRPRRAFASAFARAVMGR
jgi:squalene synthase HpnC